MNYDIYTEMGIERSTGSEFFIGFGSGVRNIIRYGIKRIKNVHR